MDVLTGGVLASFVVVLIALVLFANAVLSSYKGLPVYSRRARRPNNGKRKV